MVSSESRFLKYLRGGTSSIDYVLLQLHIRTGKSEGSLKKKTNKPETLVQKRD